MGNKQQASRSPKGDAAMLRASLNSRDPRNLANPNEMENRRKAFRSASSRAYGFRKITKKGDNFSTVSINDPWNTTYQQPN